LYRDITKLSAANEQATGAKRLCADGLALPRIDHRRPDMSATVSTIVRPEVTTKTSTFLRLFSACWDGIAAYFVRRAAIASLQELNDRALSDIGITRSQIEAAVRGFVPLRDQARIP